jgi:hypothetical protein
MLQSNEYNLRISRSFDPINFQRRCTAVRKVIESENLAEFYEHYFLGV